MLSSLAVGARELAGLPSILPSARAARSASLKNGSASALYGKPQHLAQEEQEFFPSKRLPGKLHDHFLSATQHQQQQQQQRNARQRTEQQPDSRALDAVSERIMDIALSATRQSAEQTVPGASKEKLLTVHARPGTTKILRPVSLAKSSSAAAVQASMSMTTKHTQPRPTFAHLGAETFIMPLMNRFWLYMRDVATSPQRSSGATAGPYVGGLSGVPAVLEPLLLSKFLSTLTVMMDAARHSPHFLAVLAPESLELVLAIAQTSASSSEPGGGGSTSNEVEEAALQLTLVVLDASTALDAGRTLSRDSGKLTWAVKDWAEAVWDRREREGTVRDAGGRAAAGVLLRLDEVVSKSIGYR